MQKGTKAKSTKGKPVQSVKVVLQAPVGPSADDKLSLGELDIGSGELATGLEALGDYVLHACPDGLRASEYSERIYALAKGLHLMAFGLHEAIQNLDADQRGKLVVGVSNG
jgi:hypothetical protein